MFQSQKSKLFFLETAKLLIHRHDDDRNSKETEAVALRCSIAHILH